MSAKRLEENEPLQVGDIILCDQILGKRKYIVHRLTKKYAFVRYNEVAEGKFPAIYKRFGFTSLPRERWTTCQYTAYRPRQEGS